MILPRWSNSVLVIYCILEFWNTDDAETIADVVIDFAVLLGIRVPEKGYRLWRSRTLQYGGEYCDTDTLASS